MALPRDLEDADIRLSHLEDERLARAVHYLAEIVIGQLPEQHRAAVRRSLRDRGLLVAPRPTTLPE